VASVERTAIAVLVILTTWAGGPVDDRPQAPPVGQNASGVGGAGGADPGPGPDNLCECAAQTFSFAGSSCADCINELTIPTARCGEVAAACIADEACLSFLQVLDDCGGDPACLSAALATSPGHDKYVAILACACNDCGARCRFPQSLACEVKPPATTGAGAGGAGGEGG
jgi:hypothetical protein